MDPKPIESLATRIDAIFREAFTTLIERRDTVYAAGIAPLDAEIEGLRREDAALQEASQNLAAILPARARQAQFEADRLTVEGKSTEAEAKLAEATEAANAPRTMAARQAEIAKRIAEIEGEKKAIGHRVFEGWYPEARGIIGAAETGLFLTLLDGLEQSIRNFAQRTSVGVHDSLFGGLNLSNLIAGLTAPERSAEWRAASGKWYQGRIR